MPIAAPVTGEALGDATLPTGPFGSAEEYYAAIGLIQDAAVAYYRGDGDRMDDASYDALVLRLKATEAQHPEWKAEDSPTETVAAGAALGGDVVHSEPMLSLDNVFSADELRDWVTRLVRAVGRPVGVFTVEPKIDGLAIAARYVGGELIQVATRGDGRSGEDVTAQARRAAGLPATLTEPVTLEVRGEVFMTEADFETANELRVASGGEPFANPRNGAAGSIRAQNRAYAVPLSFLAYAAHGLPQESHLEAMAYLARLGVATTAGSAAGMPICRDADELVTAVDALNAARAGLGFEVDGAVVKADSAADREAAGSSSRAPRWGIAYKYPAAVRTTKLLDIELQVGRTGVITPVAVLEPVQVGGVTVRSATLHNFTDLILRDVHVGDTVFVRRAGEVIPEVVGAKLDERSAGSVPFTPPVVCPHCGAEIDRSQKRWRCTRGRACKAAESLSYAVGRDALDIDGLGDTLLEALVASGRVVDLADLFDLDVATLAAMERLGDVSATKLVTNLQAAKDQPLARVLTALGVRMTGRSMSRRLAAHFGSMAALQAAPVEQLQGVDGVGPERAVTIAAELRELAPVIARLAERGVRLADEAADTTAVRPLRKADGTSMTVVVTGSVPGLTRTEGNEAVEALGGKSSSSVSKKTDLVVAGDGAGSKAEKAVQLKVPVLASDRFADLLAAARAGDTITCTAILTSAGLADG